MSFIDKLKYKFYQIKQILALKFGSRLKFVEGYNKAMIEGMREVTFCDIPASIWLFSNRLADGNCFINSLLMTQLFLDKDVDVKLVNATINGTKLQSDKVEDDKHWFLEVCSGGKEYVIDVAKAGIIYDKRLYWLVEKPQISEIWGKEAIRYFINSEEFKNREKEEKEKISIPDLLGTILEDCAKGKEIFDDILKEEINIFNNTGRTYYKGLDVNVDKFEMYKADKTNESIFCEARKKLYFEKLNRMYVFGVLTKKIFTFDDEFYDSFKNNIYLGLPVSLILKHRPSIVFQNINPNSIERKCFDYALMLFLFMEDATWVRGDVKNLELEYGKDSAFHDWIEKDGYVYDVHNGAKFEKDFYYKMFKCSNVRKWGMEEYCSIEGNKKLVEDFRSITIDDYRPNGKRRLDLLTKIPMIKSIAIISGNQDFINDLNAYLELIEYDEEQIYNQMNEWMSRI